MSITKAVAAVYSFWRWVGEISLLTPVRLLLSNYWGQDYLVTSTNRDALPVTKTEALRHFILGMKQPLHLETTSSGSESVTVYIQSFTSEPKIKYPCGKKERIPHPPHPRAIPFVRHFSAFLSQKQFAQHFAGCTDWFTKEGGQADICNIGLTEL